jgi:uncharacterized protein
MNTVMDVALAASRRAATFVVRAASPWLLSASVFIAATVIGAIPAPAQQSPLPERRVIVIGEGSVTVAPDHARIRSGVTTRAKTAKDAADANSKVMAAIIAALLNAAIEQKDIQTSRFSVQPTYTSPQPNTEQKLSGFSVSNQVSVTIREIDKVSEILDRLITTGATDAGSVEFRHSDSSKALDRAREAAVADARRKAELYARAADLSLGSVTWITEDSEYVPSFPKAVARPAAMAAAPPIAAGEDTLHVRITVGFEMTH